MRLDLLRCETKYTGLGGVLIDAKMQELCDFPQGKAEALGLPDEFNPAQAFQAI
jgi:hypothetical protein